MQTTNNVALLSEKQFDEQGSRQRCLQMRRRILEVSQMVPALHIGGSFSCLEMVESIYSHCLRKVSGNFHDTFIISKGHGCLAQYVNLEHYGILPKSALDLFCKPDGVLGTHPDLGIPGVEASTGALGHGLGIGMGMANADKILGADRNVYVVISDGELQEGSIWENILLAPALKLNRLVVLADLNDFQSLARMSETHPNFYPLIDKIKAFGWECKEVNGHNAKSIFDAIANRSGEAPFFVACKTVKGKGVAFMENQPIWHFRSPNIQEYERALQELVEVYE
ncbi:MAG: transketolase [Proteobacteria bacterium]|nr:transketolase [Pseudomonadota bacterium]